MKITFEPEDADIIAQRVVELLQPILREALKRPPEEEVFSPETLAGHLHVPRSWVYKQVSLKTIPFFKAGKYIRFRRSAIDRWMQEKQGGMAAYTTRLRN